MQGFEKKNPIDRLVGEQRELALSLSKLSALQIRKVAYAAAGQDLRYEVFRPTDTAPQMFAALRRGKLDLLLPDIWFLRAQNQPLYDTVIVQPPNGPSPKAADVLFVDHMKFEDGTMKMERDSNLRQAGQLGFPLEFEIEALELRFEEYGEPEDVRRFLSGTTVIWFSGEDIPQFSLTASLFDPCFLAFKSEDIEIKEAAVKLVEAGLWPICRKTIRKRTITSHEPFRVEFRYDKPLALSAPLRVKALMLGTLWR